MKNEDLTPKQKKAVRALCSTGNVTQAAREVKVTRETLYQWMKDPRFQVALQEETAQGLDSLSRGMVDLGAKAFKTLRDALDDEQTSPAVKIKVAGMVLGRMSQLQELTNVENRITRLEKTLEDKTNNKN